MKYIIAYIAASPFIIGCAGATYKSACAMFNHGPHIRSEVFSNDWPFMLIFAAAMALLTIYFTFAPYLFIKHN